MAEVGSLPEDVLSWIASAAGAPVVSADRIPGGATREGWFVDVGRPEGPVRELFLRFSPKPLPERSAFHRLATEAAIMRALGPTEVAVPTIVAVHPEREAVLSERVAGATWFYRIGDPDEQVRVADDFMRNLAALHRLDPATLGIEPLGPVASPRRHAIERLAAIRRRGTGPDGSMDPLLRFTVDWLEAHVPDYDGPAVLVQGDTGPGNFMYQDGRVTAVVDWELAHWGDPMDDIAWVSLRTVQDTFTHLPDRLKTYSALSGYEIDEQRIWYYRLFAEATMTTLYPHEGEQEAARDTSRSDIGNLLIYRQLHRRLWLEALMKVMGLDLPEPELPEPVAVPEWHHLYGEILGTLRTIAPRIADPLAGQWVKGVARVVKYLEDLDRSGRDFAALELEEIGSLLGRRPPSLEEGRRALADAVRAGQVGGEDYVRYMWHRTCRDDRLMRGASGALHERTWPPVL
ncbi:MAG TPA: phosphotransferase family protein [Acidimicrobiales bacterium]|nr:phosphotransferase family protein [Acidimicrobiales bacterium]